MNIRDIELGDVIRLKSGKEVTIIAVYDSGAYNICHSCKDGFCVNDLIFIAWNAPNSRYKYIPNWKDCAPNNSFEWYSGIDHIDCIVKKANAQDIVQSRAVPERPCPQCGRKNDIGVKECWNCMQPNP